MWRRVILNFLRWAIPRPAGSCPNLHNVLKLRVFPISSSRGSACTSTRGTCGDASNAWFFTRNRLPPASVTSLNRRQLKPVDPSPDKRCQLNRSTQKVPRYYFFANQEKDDAAKNRGRQLLSGSLKQLPHASLRPETVLGNFHLAHRREATGPTLAFRANRRHPALVFLVQALLDALYSHSGREANDLLIPCARLPVPRSPARQIRRLICAIGHAAIWAPLCDWVSYAWQKPSTGDQSPGQSH